MKHLRTYEYYNDKEIKNSLREIKYRIKYIKSMVNKIFNKYQYKKDIFEYYDDNGFVAKLFLGKYIVVCFCDKIAFDIYIKDENNKEYKEYYHVDVDILSDVIDEWIAIEESEELGLL